MQAGLRAGGWGQGWVRAVTAYPPSGVSPGGSICPHKQRARQEKGWSPDCWLTGSGGREVVVHLTPCPHSAGHNARPRQRGRVGDRSFPSWQAWAPDGCHVAPHCSCPHSHCLHIPASPGLEKRFSPSAHLGGHLWGLAWTVCSPLFPRAGEGGRGGPRGGHQEKPDVSPQIGTQAGGLSQLRAGTSESGDFSKRESVDSSEPQGSIPWRVDGRHG